MIDKLEVHHIGVAVFSVEAAANVYAQLGYSVSAMVLEDVQKVRVAYARKEGSPTIELLEPLNDKSPVCNILKKLGNTPYHICYSVPDIKSAVAQLKTQHFMPLGRPIPGHGLDDALMCFLFHKDIGLIQLVEI